MTFPRHPWQFLPLLLLLVAVGPVWGQSVDSTQNRLFQRRYSLPEYVPDPRKAFADNMSIYLDALGRALVQHENNNDSPTSWFYGAYALLKIDNDNEVSHRPLGDIQKYVPVFWRDLRELTIDDLIRKVDAVLSHGVTVPLYRPERPFQIQVAEEQLVNFFNGMRHLKMLRYTVGDSLFEMIVQNTDDSGVNGQTLTDTLVQQIATTTSPRLAHAFFQALKTAERTDPYVDKVEKMGNDSLRVWVKQAGAWNFPVTLRIVYDNGDTVDIGGVWPGDDPIWLPVSAKIRQVIVDPQEELVEIHRSNNFWPQFPQTVMVQPFWGLPSWEYYKVIVTPFSWRDWNEVKRYGVRASGGIGIDLMPLYPSDYHHRWMVEVSAYEALDELEKWGLTLDYGHPLSWPHRLFIGAKVDLFQDFRKAELGLTKYVGVSRYPFQGFRLEYHRYTGSGGVLYYDNPTVWGDPLRLPYIAINTTRFTMTEAGHQLHYSGTILSGWDGEQPFGQPFTLYRGRISLGGLFGNWLRAEFSGVGGLERGSVPYPFEFTQSRGWVDAKARIPGLQGQPTREDPVYAYMGTRVSLGYWLGTFQPKVFASTMIYGDDQTPFAGAPLEKAAGIGIEHQSFFFLGVYFPFWQSHPVPGEEPWAFRYQWKFGLYL
ncbi:MAG: hypothetical protein K9N11_09925 [Lentisphaeria bacterium]|nr:hypothetical protein [Candidatus Neomarinimicrobiota bacterium]MCF7843150.1 hypothetical protein [Lentisphaeria bacterium]